MDNPKFALAALVLELIFTNGIPAARAIFAGLENDNPTMADIERLREGVSALTEDDFK